MPGYNTIKTIFFHIVQACWIQFKNFLSQYLQERHTYTFKNFFARNNNNNNNNNN